jgi:hypothetical protein
MVVDFLLNCGDDMGYCDMGILGMCSGLLGCMKLWR